MRAEAHPLLFLSEAGSGTWRSELGTFLSPKGAGSIGHLGHKDGTFPSRPSGVIWQSWERKSWRGSGDTDLMSAHRRKAGAGETETPLSNNLELQIRSDREFLGMGLDIKLWGNKGIFVLWGRGRLGMAPQIGNPINKNVFASPKVFVLCVNVVARHWTPGCPVTLLPIIIFSLPELLLMVAVFTSSLRNSEYKYV